MESIKVACDFTSSCKILFERVYEYRDATYLVIYGTHINGYFICMPGYKIACEAAEKDNVIYNAAKLHAAGLTEEEANAIATAISENVKK